MKNNLKGGLNRMKTILMVSLLTLMIVSIFAGAFVLAEDVTDLAVDNSDLNQAEIEQSLSVIGPVGALIGYAEKTDGSDARHIRMWIGKVRTTTFNASILEEAKNLKEQYKGDPAVLRQKLKELLQNYKPKSAEIDSYQGILVIGRGKEHVTYRLLEKNENDVNNGSISFYILPQNLADNSTANEKKGFFVGLGRKLGIIKTPKVITSTDTSNLDVVGELSLDRIKFDSITLWKGDMNLESGSYKGDWNMDLMSAKSLWWPNPGLHKKVAGQQTQGQPFAETDN
ncbi:MAG: hypothetical protein NTX24_03630 [Candidatus Pacearchaeota archaeon]|nr:hypothetical protein [Candidatus Pacearchaeota archaeon]